MTSVMRNLILALPMAAILAACGNAPIVLSEEEKAARVTVNPFSENLVPDATLAASTITLPAAQPSGDWLQSGSNASKVPGHLVAGEQFKVDWRVSAGEGSGELKRIVAAPVAKAGRIYTIDSNQVVTAFDTASGKRVWENKLKASNPKWDEYTEARDDMFKFTHSEWAPWIVAQSDDKKKARLNIISEILKRVPYKTVKRAKVSLPKRKVSEAEAAKHPVDHVEERF